MKQRIPGATLAVMAGALFIAVAPASRDFLIYDCDRIFSGEFWRMFTGHWVHLSTRHLLIDVCAFGIIGSIIEATQLPYFRALCFFGPWLISAASLRFAPEMQRYGGLSALALSAFVFFAVHGLRNGGLLRTASLTMLTLAGAKVLFELNLDSSLFVPAPEPRIHVAAISHLAGAIIGALFALLPTFKPVPACVSKAARAKQVPSESPDYSRQV